MFLVSIVVLYIAYLMFRPKEGLGDIKYFREHLDAMGKMTRREKVNAIVLVLLVLYVFTTEWTGLTMELGFAIIPFLLYLPGINGAEFETALKTNFEMLSSLPAAWPLVPLLPNLGLQMNSLICA